MNGLTFDRLLVPLPDLEGRVHGIVSLVPPMVQCDGCGLTATGHNLALTVLTCGIKFYGIRDGDHRRLCTECATSAGMVTE